MALSVSIKGRNQTGSVPSAKAHTTKATESEIKKQATAGAISRYRRSGSARQKTKEQKIGVLQYGGESPLQKLLCSIAQPGIEVNQPGVAFEGEITDAPIGIHVLQIRLRTRTPNAASLGRMASADCSERKGYWYRISSQT